MILDGLILPLDRRLTSLFEGGGMPPFSIDKPRSPGSLSPEESPCNSPGSEREGEEGSMGPRGTKRKEKNRNAARKSRRKQTERADELHEELQQLEGSNVALQKEIASLRRDLHLYTRALERHEPSCLLRDAASTSSSCQARSSPPQASIPPRTTAHSTSLSPRRDLVSPDRVENPHLSSSSPTTTAEDSSTSSSSEVLTPSTSLFTSYSVSLSTSSAPHSLFGHDPPPSKPANIQHPLTDLPSTAALPQSQQEAVQHYSSTSADFSPVVDFLMKPDLLSITSSNDVMPPYSSLASGFPFEWSQLLSGHLRGDQVSPGQPHSQSSLQDSAPDSLPGSPEDSPQLPPASVSASTPSYSQDISPDPASLLSLLISPRSPDVPPTSYRSFDGPPASPAPVGNTSRDLSFSALLEDNDWILQ